MNGLMYLAVAAVIGPVIALLIWNGLAVVFNALRVVINPWVAGAGFLVWAWYCLHSLGGWIMLAGMGLLMVLLALVDVFVRLCGGTFIDWQKKQRTNL